MKMHSFEFISLSACTMMLTALGIDVMLPAFGEVRRHFGLAPDSTAAAQIISFFFMGQIAQILFGALSDSWGRLATLRLGFPLYIVGGIAAAFAPTLTVMFIARFISGVGASAVFMTTIAGVRDRYVGDEMARIMSLIFTIFLFTPVAAPFLGVAILSVSTWQVVFLAPPIFAVIVFFWSLRLEESLPPEKRVPLRWTSIKQSVLHVLANRTFLRYTLVATLLFTVLSAYISSSEHIVGEIYARPHLFPWIFGGMGLLMSFCSFTNSYLSSKFGARRTVQTLLIIYTVIAAGLLVVVFVTQDPPDMVVFFVVISVLMSLNLAIEPNSSSLALEPMGDTAGMASAVYGTFFFSVGASLGALISYFLTHGIFALALSFFVAGVIAVALVTRNKRK
ncbi:MFS transporter [Pseudochryseolinea flava]|uniref:MFS transporter n=1 Tax=Pseudochryseolinea flava TaxID=2059302 RepID=A0A364XW03_9BACT|nr:MFS transporter [Pseudochryseolinea flava]